jgi:hypothetical protein
MPPGAYIAREEYAQIELSFSGHKTILPAQGNSPVRLYGNPVNLPPVAKLKRFSGFFFSDLVLPPQIPATFRRGQPSNLNRP